MAQLEQLKVNQRVRGIRPNQTVTIIQTFQRAPGSLTVFYQYGENEFDQIILYPADAERLEIVTDDETWAYDADPALVKYTSEALRIRWGYLFDPYMAIHTSRVRPLPHQITAVYDQMLPRQPLRFLLADDPGAGKTIMAGLLIKELTIRGDLRRCLIVCPGGLVEQWQDELWQRFQLPFEIITNDRINASRTGNIFNEMSLAIGRIDKLARDEALHPLLDEAEWDLIVCDEAHKMSASFFGGKINYTKRYQLGERLRDTTRHFLLMTATPHNGKEEDFQLFLKLLDEDRFEGRFRDGVHKSDVGDLMRRMVKEQLYTFEGKRLFPERRAYTVNYKLTNLERELYDQVTDYVRNEFNRADSLEDGRRRGSVGFALTILQRRLASSPAAIYQSLRRRREKLEKRLVEVELGQTVTETPHRISFDEFDEEDYLASELEDLDDLIVKDASTARTADELRLEIEILRQLAQLAHKVRHAGTDRKWEQLSGLLQDQAEMFDSRGRRRKLIIFTEHRDTLTYLRERICALLGRVEAVVEIHGNVKRRDRRAIQEAFTNDPDVLVMLATDAAGEGINLQRAHLMVNYDLPWNPNRLEQRFGRIHRIGQRDVCHLWNLVASSTREGDVYSTLLRKLEKERESLGGAVFDVLGKAMDGKTLRRLMIEAIRYGDSSDVQARHEETVEGAFNRERLNELLKERALSEEMMGISQVATIRQQIERVEARRLQPHYIQAFFTAAFKLLGGTLRQREAQRFSIPHVPAVIRDQARRLSYGNPVARKYDRICFEKEYVEVQGKPTAEFVAPGHPLLDAVIALMLDRHQEALQQGTVLIDAADYGTQPRLLFYLQHAIKSGGKTVSQRVQFVELATADGQVANAGLAPYLDYRIPKADEMTALADEIARVGSGGKYAQQVIEYAVGEMVTPHLEEVRAVRVPLIEKTMREVHKRLMAEIYYWNNQASVLREKERKGKRNAKLNSGKAQANANKMQHRLKTRMAELQNDLTLAPQEPTIIGRTLIIPRGLVAQAEGATPAQLRHMAVDAAARKRVERAAMDAIMAVERQLGNAPRDVGALKLGYDIESLTPAGDLRFIEVKGRHHEATTVTVTHNEVIYALNKPDNWFLALAMVKDGAAIDLRYVLQPFERPPDYGAESVNYNLLKLWKKGFKPT